MHEALNSAIEISEEGIAVYRVDLPDRRAMESHAHAQGQLFSLQSGLSIVETSAGSWMFPPRRCGWIPAGHVHSVRSGGLVSGWLLYLAAPLCQLLPKKPMVLALSPLLEHLVLRIASWEKLVPPKRSRKNLLQVLVDEICIAQEEPLHLPVPIDPRLRQLVEQLIKAPERDRPLAEWARWLGMSERSLQRNFQREVGMSIGQWRQQLRILVGLEKLTEGLSVTDTSFAVGYNNVSAFIKTFKRTVGVPPLEYIKKQRNSQPKTSPMPTEFDPAISALSR